MVASLWPLSMVKRLDTWQLGWLSWASSTALSAAARSHAAVSTCTWAPHATHVMSEPSRTTSALPRGSSKSPTGTSCTDARYSRFGSKKMVGFGSRIDASSSPLAVIASRG